MDIKWKQKHINNACASACLAVLLSQKVISYFKLIGLPFYNEKLKKEFEEALENKTLL